MKRIVIIGGGFAGVWSAMGVARKLHELEKEESVEVVLVSKDSYLNFRPRFYESNLSQARVSLDQVLKPIRIKLLQGLVIGIDFNVRCVNVETTNGKASLPYDRLVLASGSYLRRPSVPGLNENAFAVDTYEDAVKLDQHIKQLYLQPDVQGKYTTIVIGAGLTGIEVAAEMVSRLREASNHEKRGKTDEIRVVLIERSSSILPKFGSEARSIVNQALSELGIVTRTNVTVTSIDRNGVLLNTGERISALTTIWTGGLRASELTEFFPVVRDELGRLPVDEFLRVKGMEGVFAAGDVARAMTDENHVSLMSCQHAIPQGKYVGHNVVSDLFGENMIPYQQRNYVTCLDLGEWGALFTKGWEQIVLSTKADAKKIKRKINESLIYPPLSGDKNEILEAASLPT